MKPQDPVGIAGGLNYAIVHHTVEMDVRIKKGAETANEGDGGDAGGRSDCRSPHPDRRRARSELATAHQDGHASLLGEATVAVPAD